MTTVKICREHGPSPCRCHPDATHRHFASRTFKWTEYQGHSHNVLVTLGGRDTYCTHDGCAYTGTYDPNPVTIRRQ